MVSNISHAHHYVPVWYQCRFLKPGQQQLHVLDKKPDKVMLPSGKSVSLNSYFRKSPSASFYKEDLYMLRFGSSVTDTIEKTFFGEIDRTGCIAVDAFSQMVGFTKELTKAHHHLIPYMGAQRFRTPRALDWIKQRTLSADHNQTLKFMGQLFQQHTTMWGEGIWEIVSAKESQTKFIVSDEPITFYNSHLPPSMSKYPGNEEIPNVGTRTIFPLGPNACLIITHLEFTRNPDANPVKERINARMFDQVVMHMGAIQFGRELEENEVLRLNLILKLKATRYIAAGDKEWLYPEKYLRNAGWVTLDRDWFLFPNLWKINFTSEIMVGHNDGSTWASDDYGRHPGDPKFKNDQARRDREWRSRRLAQHKWAKLRKEKALSHVYEKIEDTVADKMMNEFLIGISKK